MSSIFAHACAGVIVKESIKTDSSLRNNRLLLSLAIFVALLPDIDVLIYFIFKSSSIIPHRAETHSLLFAFVTCGFFTILSSRLFNIPIFKLFLIFLFSILSHLALDYLMGAGPPIPLFAPFSYKGFLSPIKVVPCAFYSKSVTGLFQLLFYPPALIGYCLEMLIFLPIILLLKKNWSRLSSAVLFIIFIFAVTGTFLIYNVMI